MSSKDRPNILHRFLLGQDPRETILPHMESTSEQVWAGKYLCDRFTFQGVPGKKVDVLVENNPRFDTWGLQVVEKIGRFDGAIRRRYCFRTVPASEKDWWTGEMSLKKTEGHISLSIQPVAGDIFTETWECLRANLDDYNIARVWMWHYRRFYHHLWDCLDNEQAKDLADQWCHSVYESGEAQNWTLAEANRAASRDLYKTSREMGWTKLTKRERSRFGLESAQQWHPTDKIDALRKSCKGHPTGCGEFTLSMGTGRTH